jgi:GDPmannose 4,6-dehydratase
MTAIIFGINGQDGHYLKLLLESKGIEVIGVSRSEGNWIKGNVKDFLFVESLIKSQQPQYIFHLAANSTTKHEVLFENHETISTGSLNILENVFRHCLDCKVFLSGSAMQFENKGIPINETTPFEASSPYAVARIQSTYAARYYRSKGLRVFVGYFFNHESPLRTPRHVSRMITDAIKRIQNGSEEKIELGDISVKKEWNFAGDFANAIYVLTQQQKVFEVVIGSGIAYSIEDWLKTGFDYIHKNWKDYVIIKKGFTPEYNLLVSDPGLLYSLGYTPQLDLIGLSKLMMSN